MDIYGVTLFFSVVGMITILGLKIYNIMEFGKFYNIKQAILLFCGYVILWLFCLVTFLNSPTEVIFNISYTLFSMLLWLNIGILFIEVLMHFKSLVPVETERNSMQYYRDNPIKLKD